MSKQKVIDWSTIETEYRAGVRTIADLAEQHGITVGAIGNRAKRYDWERDLSARIAIKRERIINVERVNSTCEKPSKPRDTRTEQQLVKSVAELQAGCILKESAEIKRLSRIAENMEIDLDGIFIKNTEADSTRLLHLERRAKILTALTGTREKIINLRRRNMGINDNANGEADKPKVIDSSLDPFEAYRTMIGK